MIIYLGNVIKEEYKCLDIIDKAYYYEYDRLGRLIRSYESEDGVIVSQTEQTYDSKGRDESYSYDGDGLSYGYEYGYNDKDRLGTTRQYYNGRNENSEVIAYGYFGRVRFRIYA